MDADLAQHLDRADADERQGDEQHPVLGRAVAERVAIDRIDEGNAEGLDATAALAAGGVAPGRCRRRRRGTGRGLLRRRRRQRVELPGGAKAGVLDRPLERQEAAGERRVRPVGRQLHPGRFADRRERQIAGADQLDRHLHAQAALARAGVSIVQSDVKARGRALEWRVPGRTATSLPSTRTAARRTPRESPSASSSSGGSQLRREPACSALRNQGAAVRPGRGQGRLHHVAVDLEDAAVARLERDLGGDVEVGRRGGQLPRAALGHQLPVLALALDRLPALGAVALQDRAEHASGSRRGWRRRSPRPRAAALRARRRCRTRRGAR